MRFSSLVALGTRAEKPWSFQHRGRDVAMLLRPLSAAEEIDAEGDAIAACKAKGAEPKEGSAIFEASRMIAVVRRGCLDPESPPSKREPLFDGGADQIARELDIDTIASLYEAHRVFQDECSPSIHHKSPIEIYEIAKKLVEEDEHDPFAYLRISPSTRTLCLRSMAAQLRILRGSSSTSGEPLSSEATPATSSGDSATPNESSPSLSPGLTSK